MRDFKFDMPTKVRFGKNCLDFLTQEIKPFGNKILLTYGGGSIKKTGLYDKVVSLLKADGFEIFELSGIKPNPSIDSVREGAKICKEKNIDVVLAVGGGSVIDCSKWICASSKVDFDPWLFFSERRKVFEALPLFTVLTLSATGSEMNSGGVISNEKTHDKKGGGSPLLLPKVSFLNPENTYTVSAYQTACGAVDIISHVLETYFSLENGFSLLNGVMETIIKTVIKFAPVAIEKPDDYEARANLMWASSWALNGFISEGQSHAWSCHPLEHQLSAYYDITHGLGLAILTPRWLEYCLNDQTKDKIAEFGINVFGLQKNDDAFVTAKNAINSLYDFFFKTLKLNSTLKEIGIDRTYFSEMAKKACQNSTINGFLPLSESDILKIYEMCL